MKTKAQSRGWAVPSRLANDLISRSFQITFAVHWLGPTLTLRISKAQLPFFCLSFQTPQQKRNTKIIFPGGCWQQDRNNTVNTILLSTLARCRNRRGQFAKQLHSAPERSKGLISHTCWIGYLSDFFFPALQETLKFLEEQEKERLWDSSSFPMSV